MRYLSIIIIGIVCWISVFNIKERYSVSTVGDGVKRERSIIIPGSLIIGTIAAFILLKSFKKHDS